MTMLQRTTLRAVVLLLLLLLLLWCQMVIDDVQRGFHTANSNLVRINPEREIARIVAKNHLVVGLRFIEKMVISILC